MITPLLCWVCRPDWVLWRNWTPSHKTSYRSGLRHWAALECTDSPKSLAVESTVIIIRNYTYSVNSWRNFCAGSLFSCFKSDSSFTGRTIVTHSLSLKNYSNDFRIFLFTSMVLDCTLYMKYKWYPFTSSFNAFSRYVFEFTFLPNLSCTSRTKSRRIHKNFGV